MVMLFITHTRAHTGFYTAARTHKKTHTFLEDLKNVSARKNVITCLVYGTKMCPQVRSHTHTHTQTHRKERCPNKHFAMPTGTTLYSKLLQKVHLTVLLFH